MTSTFNLHDYQRQGFALVRGLFTIAELETLRVFLRSGQMGKDTFAVADQDGGSAELAVWTHCGNDFIGTLPRLARMVDIATQAIGEPIYHWHSKITLKNPGHQGHWDWHQDYGHWYTEGCLSPEMMSIGVALDPMTSDNGPLRLIAGSHHLGRIDHIPIGDSNGADPQYVARALERLEEVECHLEIGDAVVFHGNTLHASGSNTSREPRSFLLSSYNALSNIPRKPKIDGHRVVDIQKVDDAALLNNQYTGINTTSNILRPEDRVYGYNHRSK